MFDFFIFLICVIFVAISVWLVNSGRALRNSLEVDAWLLSKPSISTRPKASQFQILRNSFFERLDLFVFFFYGHSNRLKTLRVSATLLGILPAWLVGIILLIMNQDIAFALSLMGLGGIIIILLLLEFRFSSRGYLDRGGGPGYYPKGFYVGHARLPKKVYAGDSRNLSIKLLPSVQTPTGEASLEVQQEDKSLALRVQIPQWNKSNSPEYLEFEMVAAGFDVQGDLRQRQVLGLHTLNYLWNCYFPNSGEHSYAILAKKINNQDSIEIGNIKHTVRVVKVGNLTQGQVYFLAIIAGVPSSIVVTVNA